MIREKQSLTSHGIQVELPPDVHPLPDSVSAYVSGFPNRLRYSLVIDFDLFAILIVVRLSILLGEPYPHP